MDFIGLLKGGLNKNKMARSMTRETEEQVEQQPKMEAKPQEVKSEEKPIQVIPESMFIINQLQMLDKKITEGFQKCGVKFD
jgi:hypothetical protein